MAKFKVLKEFQDIHTKEIYVVHSEIEMTVKRAEEVATNLDETYLSRVEEKAENKK